MKRFLHALIAVIFTASTAVVGGAQPASASGPAWWDSSYKHRLNVTIKATDALIAGYQVDVTIDHAAMVARGGSASGNDVRVVRWTGSGWSAEQPRVIAVGSPSWGNNNVRLFFKTLAPISANTADSGYWLYYGNAAAPAPLDDPNQVYDLFDDFSGATIDPAKWDVASSIAGGTVGISGGQLSVSGTATGGGTEYDLAGVATKSAFHDNYAVESTFSIVQQGSNTRNYSAAAFGTYDPHLFWMSWASPTKSLFYWNSARNDYEALAVSSMQGETFGSQRVVQTRAGGHLTQFENGNQIAKYSQSPVTVEMKWLYSPKTTGQPYDVRFDDIVVRKFAVNEPFAWVDSQRDVTATIEVASVFSFSVTGRTAACNGISPTAVATGTSIDLGRVSAGTDVSGALDLDVTSNAVGGYVVQQRGTSLTGPKVITAVTGTHAEPKSFDSDERFGYTVDDWNLPQFAGTKFASLNAAGDEVARGTSAQGTEPAKCVLYRFRGNNDTPAGSYSTAVTFTAVPTF